MRHTSRRSIPGYCRQKLAGQALAQFFIAVPGKKLPQIFAGQSLLEISLQEPFNRIWNFAGPAAVTDWASNGLMQADCAAHAEIVGILQPAIDFDLLAFNPNVCNPVLPAAIGAAGYVQLQVLLKSRKSFFELFYKPASKTLGFGNGQLAEFSSAAGDCATPKWRSAHSQTGGVQSLCQFLYVAIGNIYNQQILHVGRAQVAVSKLFGEISGSPHLLTGDSPSQYRSTHIRIPRLLLRMNAYVIAIYVIRPLLRNCRIKFEIELPLQFILEARRPPSV